MQAPSQPGSLDPGGRSPERLRAHYEIERELATRLRQSTREQRVQLYGEVYNELFERVPDHPQHTVKQTPEWTRMRVLAQVELVEDFVSPAATLLEVGAGDCSLSFAVAPKVRQVYAVEVSQTIVRDRETPANFTLVLTDGVSMPVPDGTVTVAFSNQLMEHLHPDDAVEQVSNVYRTLAPGGVYICLTPNALLGPSDISAFFDEVPTGFHLREYSTGDLVGLFKRTGFTRVRVIATAAGRRLYLPSAPFMVIEAVVSRLPRGLRKVGAIRKLICPGGGVVAYR